VVLTIEIMLISKIVKDNAFSYYQTD